VAAARDWYADILGAGPYFDQPYYVGFSVGGFELGLHPAKLGHKGADVAYWGVDDCSAALARLIAAGATPHTELSDVGGGTKLASVNDPFGNVLGIIENPSFSAEVGDMAASGADVSDLVLHKTCTVAKTPAEVWRLWTTSEGMAEWLVPKSRIELRVGGPFELYFHGDGEPGLRGGEGNRFLGFLRDRWLSFTWNAPPHLKTRPKRTWVIVAFTGVDGSTQVELTHTGWPTEGMADEDSDWPATFAYFDRAWDQVLGALVSAT